MRRVADASSSSKAGTPGRGSVSKNTADTTHRRAIRTGRSLMLAQARGQQIDLAIPEGTTIQRENECVHFEQLGVGNYVRGQATPLLPEWVGPYAISRQGNRRCQPKKGGLVCQAKPLSPSPQGHSRDW